MIPKIHLYHLHKFLPQILICYALCLDNLPKYREIRQQFCRNFWIFLCYSLYACFYTTKVICKNTQIQNGFLRNQISILQVALSLVEKQKQATIRFVYYRFHDLKIRYDSLTWILDKSVEVSIDLFLAHFVYFCTMESIMTYLSFLQMTL